MDEEYYTIEEIAKKLKVTRGAVYKWMALGYLPYIIVGKHRRITEAALRAFIKPGKADDMGDVFEGKEEEDRHALRAAA